MFPLFDIIFLRARRQYIIWKETDMPGVYAMCIVTLLQIVNIATIWFALTAFAIVAETNKFVAGIVIFSILLLNYLKFFIFSSVDQMQEKYAEKIDDKSVGKKIWIYVIVSISLLIFIIVYKQG